MVIISKYRKEERNDKFYIRSEEESICPVCLWEMYVIGGRKRKVLDANGVQQSYLIRRLQCKDCKSIHQELPDFMVPFKRHCTETIEKVIFENNDSSTSCITSHTTNSRIRNWWSVVGIYLGYILVTLEHRYVVVLS